MRKRKLLLMFALITATSVIISGCQKKKESNDTITGNTVVYNYGGKDITVRDIIPYLSASRILNDGRDNAESESESDLPDALEETTQYKTWDETVVDGAIDRMNDLILKYNLADTKSYNLTDSDKSTVTDTVNYYKSIIPYDEIVDFDVNDKFLESLATFELKANVAYEMATNEAAKGIDRSQFNIPSVYIYYCQHGSDPLEEDAIRSALEEVRSKLRQGEKPEEILPTSVNFTGYQLGFSDQIAITYSGAVNDAVSRLNVGEFSEVVEDDSGFFVIYKMDDADDMAISYAYDNAVIEARNTAYEKIKKEKVSEDEAYQLEDNEIRQDVFDLLLGE